MKLKRLALQGYKTFASRTHFEFDEGITAIVGPNGSGKSNIADAIRWVLGEQSYSTLRGKRTTDMIFAGSQQRSRAGMAQAILTLDNSDGWLPIDFTEIEIGRRAHRSGDNEYLLNGQKVRLRDISELLAKSGLAQRTYTVIGQGLVDQALSLRADERRMLFEEAAGVSHYKQRRAETIRRLEETSHNLERVQDIVAEIRPRLGSLRRQANRAQNYEQVAADLRHLLQIWYGYQWEQNRVALREARQESESAHKDWVETRDKQIDLQERLDAGRKELNTVQQRLSEFEKAREEVRDRLENARREVAVLSERQALLKRQLEEHADELPALQAQRDTAAKELERSLQDLEQAEQEMALQEAELKSFEARFHGQQVEIDRWQQNVANLRVDYEQTTDALAQAKGRLTQLASQLRERLAESNQDAEVRDLEQKVNALREKIAEKREQLADIEDRRRSKLAEQRSAKNELDETRERRRQVDDELAKMNQAMAGLESQLLLLDRTQFEEHDFPATIPHLGQLVDLIDIPEAYQRAIRAALGHRILTWILHDENAIWELRKLVDSRRILVTVKDYDSGIDSDRPAFQGDDRVAGWADELVTARQSDRALVRRLLGNIIIVNDPRDAYELASRLPPGSLTVSVDGVVADANGLVHLGAGQEGVDEIAKKDERQQVADQLAELGSRRAQLMDRLAEADHQIVALESAYRQISDKCAELEDEARVTTTSLNSTQAAEELARQRLEFRRADIARSEEQIERLEQKIREQKATVDDYDASVVKISLALKEGQHSLEQLPVVESSEARKQLKQEIASARTILAGRQAVVDSRQATLNQVQDQLRRRKARYAELQSRWEASELVAKEKALAALQGEMESLRQEIAPLQESMIKGRNEVSKLEDRLTQRQRRSHEAETRYTQARIELTQLESKIDGLKERIQADLGLVALTYDDDQPAQSPLPMAEIVEQLPTVEILPEDIEESIRRYRGQLNRIGSINPEAPTEYEELLKRHDFLIQQSEDLSATKQRLREVIADLDDLTSQAFVNTVEEVNGVFGEVFERLFGGGSAQLALTDPDDLTITGVDIVARLPRRREQGLALLSGGERSLTAAALIFALLKVSPTPFCVLDEVDAMLDEANINRFREVLSELSARTQFIVITHNRGTVQVAESVYGVSMGADSVSQVISIKPEDYIKQHAN